MISRKTIYSILLGLVGVLIITWRMGIVPARVVVINQSGIPVGKVIVTTEDGRYDMGSIGNGQTKKVAVNPTATLRLTYQGKEVHVWNAPKGLSAGQSIVLYVVPDEKIVARDRIGDYAR